MQYGGWEGVGGERAILRGVSGAHRLLAGATEGFTGR